ncbi:Glutamate receptor 1-like [Camponotus japonicus]
MVERCMLTITVFQFAIIGCCAVSGIIWLKQRQEFVQLSSIPQFAALQKENLAKRRAIKIRDMKNEIVRAVYYEEKNMIMFYDNDTKVNGICGDLWYLLADYLNFTFIPMKTTNRDFGEKLKNGSYTGVIGMVARNEAQAIMRSGYFISCMDVLDYTMVLWKSQFHIYIHPDWQFDNTWVFTLFCPKTWYSIVFLFIILSFVGYFLQKIPMDYKLKKEISVNFSLSDHFFHSFAMMCGQGYIPDAFYNKFKILSISKSIFAWLVLLAFSSHLIYRMTIKETTLPFNDLDTLFSNTKRILLAFRGSNIYYYLHDKYANNTNGKNLLNRIQFISIAQDMHNTICDNMKKYAMYEIDDRFMALNRNGCPLLAVGNYNETYISFGFQKNYPYKKTIDYALIKFNEVGLMDALKDRWMNIRMEEYKNIEEIQFKMIDLHQVYLIFLILCWGTLISLVILVLENIIYYYEKRKRSI